VSFPRLAQLVVGGADDCLKRRRRFWFELGVGSQESERCGEGFRRSAFGLKMRRSALASA